MTEIERNKYKAYTIGIAGFFLSFGVFENKLYCFAAGVMLMMYGGMLFVDEYRKR